MAEGYFESVQLHYTPDYPCVDYVCTAFFITFLLLHKFIEDF